jgi:hypothetical protein
VVPDASLLTQRSCQGKGSDRLKQSMERKSPLGVDWRVGADESLGDDSEYRRALLMRMVVKFTHQVGKKFPGSAIHGAESEQRCAGVYLLMGWECVEVQVP